MVVGSAFTECGCVEVLDVFQHSGSLCPFELTHRADPSRGPVALPVAELLGGESRRRENADREVVGWPRCWPRCWPQMPPRPSGISLYPGHVKVRIPFLAACCVTGQGLVSRDVGYGWTSAVGVFRFVHRRLGWAGCRWFR